MQIGDDPESIDRTVLEEVDEMLRETLTATREERKELCLSLRKEDDLKELYESLQQEDTAAVASAFPAETKQTSWPEVDSCKTTAVMSASPSKRPPPLTEVVDVLAEATALMEETPPPQEVTFMAPTPRAEEMAARIAKLPPDWRGAFLELLQEAEGKASSSATIHELLPAVDE